MSSVIKSKEEQKLLIDTLQGNRNKAIALIGLNTGIDPKSFTTLSYNEYMTNYNYIECDYLNEQSQNNKNSPLFYHLNNKNMPLNYRSINRILKQAAFDCGLLEHINITTESLKKTYYYNLYISGIPLEEISSQLNHPTKKRTSTYLELDTNDIAIHSINYGYSLLNKKEE